MLSSRISRISNVTAPLIHQAIPPTAAAFNALPPLDIASAAKRLNGVATRTPLQFSRGLSKRYNAQIYLKREDLQVVSIRVSTSIKFYIHSYDYLINVHKCEFSPFLHFSVNVRRNYFTYIRII